MKRLEPNGSRLVTKLFKERGVLVNSGQVASEEILVKIHKHLRYVYVLVGPEARSTRSRIDEAQEHIERCIGRRPMLLEGESPSKPAFEHLREAHALAGEHLGPGKQDRKILRAIREALSEADREFDRL